MSSPGILESLRRSFSLPKADETERLVRGFSPTDWAITLVLTASLALSAASMVLAINNTLMVEVPTRGGELTEGVIGTARFINPLLAISDADRDLVALAYSGLLRPGTDGSLAPDLAHSYEVSADGLTYTFVLKEDAVFHDGERVTSDDVVFTVLAAQDPALKSPKRANWEGVAAEALDERTVRFTLSQPYAPFLENLTMGILPAHIWSSITADEFLFSDFNVRPVGSGPFRVAKVKRNASGIPDTYELAPFERSTREAAYLSRITVRLYPNKEAARDAFLRGEIEAVHSVNPDELKLSDREAARETVLSRVFGVFYNQNKAEVLTDASVREALGVAIDRERIVNAVLGGYGTPARGPLPPQNIADAPDAGAGDRIASARALLEAGGWMWNEPEPDEETGAMTAGFWSKKSGKTTTRLSMTLTTASVPELKQVAEMVREDWEGAGVPTTLQFFEQNDLQQNVIRPREYEALLFGEVVGRELDLFAFWHASQRNDPGLNVALYASITVDKLLEEARVEQDPVQRLRLAEKAAEDIASDFPAAFIYVPSFVYVLPERIKGYDVRSISVPSERFANVSSWYVSTERVWKPFAGERTVVSAPSF